jgi:UDP-N-acetylmuramoyl-tripeptide--D-alanyl-D-alanine ligase
MTRRRHWAGPLERKPEKICILSFVFCDLICIPRTRPTPETFSMHLTLAELERLTGGRRLDEISTPREAWDVDLEVAGAERAVIDPATARSSCRPAMPRRSASPGHRRGNVRTVGESGGAALPQPPTSCDHGVALGRVRIDSREIEPGDVFWALPGRNVQGSDFAADAYRRGASGVVTQSAAVSPPRGRWALAVENAQRALWQVAAEHRRRFNGRMIAVTGSVGKTTTREMIHAVLAPHQRGTASQRNYNNHLGVPLSLLSCSPRHSYAVIEVAASACGEIAELAALAQPRIGVITRIGEAHLGGFGGREQLARSKGELLAALPGDGLAVLNGDDPVLRRMERGLKTDVVWFGKQSDCDIVATDVYSGNGRLRLTIEQTRFEVPVWGRHHLTSVLAAAAVGRAFGHSLDDLAEALVEFQAPPMRCQVIDVHGAKVINDCYNASPTSMRAALDLLREFDTSGQRIVVCGDMRELGSEEAQWHRELGTEIVTRCGADLLVACGQRSEEVVAAARRSGMPGERTFACQDALDAVPRLNEWMREGDVVLVKGSRASALERLIEAIEREQNI